MRKVTYISHSFKGTEWDKHSYTGKHRSKNGKIVYEYGSNSGDDFTKDHDWFEDDQGMKVYSKRGADGYTSLSNRYVISNGKATYRTNIKSNKQNGYGTVQYDEKDKNGNVTHVTKTVEKGNTWLTKKSTIDMGTRISETVSTGKLRQAAEKGASWINNKLSSLAKKKKG